MRNYCGILLNPKTYSELGYIVENKLVFNSYTNDEQSKERLWFMCGYDDSIFMVVSKGTTSEETLVDAGMLIDLRVTPQMTFPSSFFDFALHKLSSKSERVRLCNSLRDILASRSSFRWCGAELESIFNKNVVMNASEINGLALLGKAISCNGILQGTLPEIVTSNYSFDLLRHIEQFEDEGQRKLAVVFHSFAIANSTIVYVGSAPGKAWLSALAYYPNVARVISIDPRLLESNNSDNRVSHFLEEVKNCDQLYEKVAGLTDCALIWDVRGDARDADDRDIMIIREIDLLNSILADVTLHVNSNFKI